ncbi:MAG TPA: hypothetical protein VEC06_06910 [Paucimonas sp.]|nr:hypothetical protein [Paucimonas sp.]
MISMNQGTQSHAHLGHETLSNRYLLSTISNYLHSEELASLMQANKKTQDHLHPDKNQIIRARKESAILSRLASRVSSLGEYDKPESFLGILRGVHTTIEGSQDIPSSCRQRPLYRLAENFAKLHGDESYKAFTALLENEQSLLAPGDRGKVLAKMAEKCRSLPDSRKMEALRDLLKAATTLEHPDKVLDTISIDLYFSTDEDERQKVFDDLFSPVQTSLQPEARLMVRALRLKHLPNEQRIEAFDELWKDVKTSKQPGEALLKEIIDTFPFLRPTRQMEVFRDLLELAKTLREPGNVLKSVANKISFLPRDRQAEAFEGLVEFAKTLPEPWEVLKHMDSLALRLFGDRSATALDDDDYGLS